MSSHGSVRSLIGRLAAAVLVASLVSPGVMALRGPRAQPRDVSPEREAGMKAAAGPAVSALVAAAPAALDAPLSLAPRALAAARLFVGGRVSERIVRPAFAVKSAPTILRV
jgi:hypothetical protein